MKGKGEYEYDEAEEQILDDEVEVDVADEKEQSHQGVAVTEPTYRRGSQRYKDRVHTMRLQSQETYQRENMGATYFSEMQFERKQDSSDEEDLEIFTRVQ